MKYFKNRIAVSFTPNIETALYFDSAACFHGGAAGFALQPLASEVFTPQSDYLVDYDSLVGDRSGFLKAVENQVIEEIFIHIKHKSLSKKKVLKQIRSEGRQENYIAEILHNKYPEKTENTILMEAKNQIVYSISNLLIKNGVYAVPFYEDKQGEQCNTEDILNIGNDDIGSNVVELSLLNVPVVDCSNLSLNHILEFKQDKKATYALQKLRLFLSGIPEDASRDYIEETILKRIEELKKKIEEHGLKSEISELKAFVNSEYLSSALALIVGAFYSGEPISQAIATTGAVALGTKAIFTDVGNVVLAFKEKKLQKIKILNDSDVEYLYMLQNIA